MIGESDMGFVAQLSSAVLEQLYPCHFPMRVYHYPAYELVLVLSVNLFKIP